VPDDPAMAVAVVFDQSAACWTRAELARLRRLVDDEYFHADRRAVLARIDDLLA